MLTWVVTTSRKPASASARETAEWAARLGARAVPRRGRSLAELCADEGVDGALVLSADRPPTCVSADGALRYYYHPGMALTRIRNLRLGLGDPMVTAMALTIGDCVLDCTLGRASDALVASYVVGVAGRVVGIESSPMLAELTIHGLRSYEPTKRELAPCFRRIDARRGDHLALLRETPDDGFGVVYLDPLFEEPVESSPAMAPLRRLADPRPLAAEALAEACRVAQRCVVIKERTDASLWERLKVDRVVGGRGSSIAYGVIVPGG